MVLMLLFCIPNKVMFSKIRGKKSKAKLKSTHPKYPNQFDICLYLMSSTIDRSGSCVAY